MRKLYNVKKLLLSGIGVALVLLVGFGSQLFAVTASAVTRAAFTTVDESVDGTGGCLNGNPNVNCNIYTDKKYVWLNGGPLTAELGNGTYFFAVLDPSGQADPNDSSAANLSVDAYTNRTFTVSGGIIAYSGSHDFDAANNKIRLLPYSDTSNPGGVYILAICSLEKGYPVTPTSCKYDAFKIQSSLPPSYNSDLMIVKDANPVFTRTYTWGISKSVDKTIITTTDSTATFNYTVNVTHDTGTDSGWVVKGTIRVKNPVTVHGIVFNQIYCTIS